MRMYKNLVMLLIPMAMGLGACKADYETDFDRSLLEVPHRSQKTIVFQRSGGSEEIAVVTNVPFDNWHAESNADWCGVEKQNGKVLVKASEYDGYQTRRALVTINYGNQEYKVRVQQMGHEALLEVRKENGVFKLKEGLFAYTGAEVEEYVIPISSNLKIDHVIVPDTVSWVSFDKATGLVDASDGGKSLHLKLTPNTTANQRYCTMTLQSSQNWDATVQFVLVQSQVGYRVVPCYGDMSTPVADLGEKLRIPFDRAVTDGTYTIEVSSDASSWLKIPDNQITDNQLSSTKNELYAEVALNLGDAPRMGSITFTSQNGGKRYVFAVQQEAFKNVAPNNVLNARATSGNGEISINWEKPKLVNYTKVSVTMKSKTMSDKLPTITKEITDINTTSVTFENTFQFAGEYEFVLKTVGPKGMETASPATISGTSGAWRQVSQVALTSGMLSSNAVQNEGAKLPGAVDNNTNTYFHSYWGRNADDNKPHRIEVSLTTPMSSEFYFDYMGRGNGNGTGDIKKAKIYGSASGAESDWTELGELLYTLPSGRGQLGATTNSIKPADGTTYKKLRFVPTERRDKVFGPSGTKDDWFNLSELRLWEVRDEAWAQKNLNAIFPKN